MRVPRWVGRNYVVRLLKFVWISKLVKEDGTDGTRYASFVREWQTRVFDGFIGGGNCESVSSERERMRGVGPRVDRLVLCPTCILETNVVRAMICA